MFAYILDWCIHSLLFRRALYMAVATGLSCAAACAEHDGSTPASTKKGIGISLREDEQWLQKIETLRVPWFYTWGHREPAAKPNHVEFVPMIWGRPGKKALEALEKMVPASDGPSSSSKYLLGFNEPDEHSQSNLTVGEALNLWPRLMRANVPLGSPGCVHADRQWMKDFMQGAQERELRVDFVCVHTYGPPDVAGLVNRLREIHQLYERPIWITEMAVGDWESKSVDTHRFPPERIATFMRELLPQLEELDFVHRYAWFSAKASNRALGTSALFDGDGKLTPLGEIYRDF